MSEAVIPVDLFNPGQVFASLGFLEAADVLLGDAEGASPIGMRRIASPCTQ
jgi:CRISPR-associated protein Csx14